MLGKQRNKDVERVHPSRTQGDITERTASHQATATGASFSGCVSLLPLEAHLCQGQAGVQTVRTGFNVLAYLFR